MPRRPGTASRVVSSRPAPCYVGSLRVSVPVVPIGPTSVGPTRRTARQRSPTQSRPARRRSPTCRSCSRCPRRRGFCGSADGWPTDSRMSGTRPVASGICPSCGSAVRSACEAARRRRHWCQAPATAAYRSLSSVRSTRSTSEPMWACPRAQEPTRATPTMSPCCLAHDATRRTTRCTRVCRSEVTVIGMIVARSFRGRRSQSRTAARRAGSCSATQFRIARMPR